MHLFVSRAGARRLSAAMVVLAAAGSAAGAQQLTQAAGNFQSTIVVSNPGVGSYDSDPQYLADRGLGSDYSGVVALWFRNANGDVISGCTGSNLGSGKILTAAHCVSNGSSLTSTTFTARYYQAGIGWVNIEGSGYAVKSGYNSNVVNENDVAVLTLSSTAPSFARTYALASVGNVLGLTQTFAGYGLTGTGLTGATVSDNIFNDNAVLRTGKNVFETTCISGAGPGIACYANPSYPAEPIIPALAGVLYSDFDHSGLSDPSTLCSGFHFCNAGFGGFQEVTIGSGDSGGAAFLDDWTISGVASFAETNGQDVGGFYGYSAGFTCVANIVGDAACQSNYDFVESQMVTTPEPATIALMATGLVGVFGAARRRRR